MYQDTSLEREGAPTRQEAERDAHLDNLEPRVPAPVVNDDPWAADLLANPNRDDEAELHF